MTRLPRRASLLVALFLLASAASARAEDTWVLWSKVYTLREGKIVDYFYAAEAFTSKPECEEAARHYKESYKSEGTREAYFKCFPHTVDPGGAKEGTR